LKNILVTGGCGFIGSNFIRLALGSLTGSRIINLDKLTYAGTPANLAEVAGNERYRFVRGDICDGRLLDALFAEEKIDAVVHFAAESHVDRSIEGPAAFIETNIMGTFALLEAARKHWLSPDHRSQTTDHRSQTTDHRSQTTDHGSQTTDHGSPITDHGSQTTDHGSQITDHGPRFLHVSTDEVYGSLGETGLFAESTAYDPRSPYSASKASSDHLVSAYHHTYGLPALITNCSNNYGPYQFPEKLIPLIINNALHGRELPVYGDGRNVRDWLYVVDHCTAILKVLEEGRIGETYNVGGNSEKQNIEVVQTICDILDEKTAPLANGQARRSLIKFVKDRAGHDRRYAIDATKIKQELGWQPAETFQDGIRRTIDWYLENGEWIFGDSEQ
jgi:dTDP-glucose 4,6-dehydratase